MGKKGFKFQLYLAAGFPNLEFLDLDGNSSRVNDIITMMCFLLFQVTAASARMSRYAEIDLLSSPTPQSASLYSSNFNPMLQLNVKNQLCSSSSNNIIESVVVAAE